MTVEEWRPVPGFDGYEVSNLGRVMSFKRKQHRVLRPSTDRAGYRVVVLLNNAGERKSMFVHRVVAAGFIGPCPEGMEVRHLDGDNQNNDLTNITYGTRSENMLDKVRHGTHHNARKTHCLRGHPFSVDNTLHSGGRRICRTCFKSYPIHPSLHRRGTVTPEVAA